MAITVTRNEERDARTAAKAAAQPQTTPQRITPLLRFLRALDVDTRKEFAAACGTTVIYLYQLAAAPDPNPRLRLAKAVVEASWKFGKRAMEKPLTYEDLLVGPHTTGSH